MTTDEAPTLELLLRHQSLVRAIARDLLVDPDAADDVVQQTWLAALRHAERGAVVGRSLLARIATNLSFNRRRETRRREGRERRVAVAEPLPSVADLVEREDERRRVVQAVFTLDDPLRETVLRRYLDDRSEREVAELLAIPVGTVRSRLRLARTILRERLGKDGDTPRSARALIALSGWSAKEASAAIVGGKGIVLMGAKAWVGVTATIAAVSIVSLLVWRSAPEGERTRDTSTAAAKSDASPAQDANADMNAPAASTTSADRSLVTAAPTLPASNLAIRMTTLRGRCITPERTPIVGAAVSSREFVETTTSDASGRFALEVGMTKPGIKRRDVDAVSVVVVMPGRVRTSKTANLGTHESIELGDFVMAIGGAIRGRVLDAGDRPVAATIELRPGTSTDVGWEFGLHSGPTFVATHGGTKPCDVLVLADSAGVFAFEGISESWYSLVALHRDWVCVAPLPVSVAAGATSDVVIRVRPVRDDERIRGRVLDADGLPVPGADIDWHASVVREAGAYFGVGREIKSDAAGAFTVFGCAGSEHSFAARLRSGAVAQMKGVRGGDPEVVLRFERSPTATLTVVDADSGNPCQSVAITAFANDHSSQRDAWTDVAGRASIELPTHDFMLTVSRIGCDSIVLGPFPGSVDPALAPIRVPRRPTLLGVVTGCDGAIAAAARVELFVVPSSATFVQRGGFQVLNATRVAATIVNSDGTFELPVGTIAPDASRAYARVEVPGFAPAQMELPRPNPLVAESITLSVTAGGSIEGHVKAPAPRSPAGLVVIAGNDDGDLTSTRVAEDGSYRLSHLRAGMWRVALAAEDLPEMKWMVALPFPEPNIAVVEGKATPLDMTTQSAGTVALSGTVRLGGVAHIGTQISIRSKISRPPKGSAFVFDPFEVAKTSVDSSGSFVVEVEEPGAYTVRATIAMDGDEVRFERAMELVAGSSHVTFDPACGTVTGTCGHPSSEGVVAHGTLADGTDVRIREKVAADGTFSMPHVPAGHFEFSVAADTVEIDVRAGETTTVNLK